MLEVLPDRRLTGLLAVVAFAAAGLLYGTGVAVLVSDWYLPILALVGLITVVATFIEPIWGLYAFVAAMFVEGLLMVEGGPTAARLVGILVFAAWLVHSLVRGSFQIAVPLQGLLGIAYVVWGLMSLSWAMDTQLVLDRAQVLVQSVALYILVINLVQSPGRLRGLLTIIVVGTLAVALLTISRALSGTIAGGRVQIEGISGYGPNSQAAYFLLSAGLLMAMFSRETRLGRKLVSLAALLVVVMAILATGSRGAMVSLVAVLACGLMLDRKSWQLLFPAVLAGGAAVSLLPATVLGRVKMLVNLSDRGAGRLDIWRVGLRVVGGHPLLGVGWGNFGKAFEEYLRRTYGIVTTFIVREKGPHNIFLGSLGELGIVGFTLFSALLALSSKRAFAAVQSSRRQRDGSTTTLVTGVLLGLVGVLVAGFFLDLRYRKFFWLILALSEVVHRVLPDAAGDL